MYKFIIPNKKLPIYFVFALGIAILNIAGFYINDSLNGQTFSISVLIGLLFIVIDLFIFSPKKRAELIGTFILLAGIFWISKGQLKFFIIDILLWALYTIARRRLIINVETAHISYPAFPKKIIPWSEVSNTVLKDDILTIDLQNNKIYQHLIEYADKEINEAEFNDFCRKQLESAGQKKAES
ncbi:MAG: hypothetical protein QM640_08695 [Niabella sp.]